MEMFLLLMILLCGSVKAVSIEDRWIFPDELDTLTKKPYRFDYFLPNIVTSPKPDRMPKGTKPEETTPLPDVLFQIPNCKCKFLPHYNPVCGSDGLSYANAQMLKCARVCGNNVKMARMGTCRGRFSVDR